MGKASGEPVRLTTPASAQRAFQDMMRQQQAQRVYMDDLMRHDPPRPPDIHIAGQVFDGLTGMRKD